MVSFLLVDMVEIICVILGIACAVGLPFGAYLVGRRSSVVAGDVEMGRLREESRQVEDQLIKVLSVQEKLASKGQIETLIKQTESFSKALNDQRILLGSITERLDKARASVEERELQQQEIRAMKQEEEEIILQVIANYHQFSTESVALERTLAESLKTIDAMSSEIKLTPDQQAVLQELANALTSASSHLRDVIIDYQNSHERLESIRSQHRHLENEYTKLIEQQLSG